MHTVAIMLTAFAKFLTKLLERKGLSKAEVARRTGKTQPYIYLLCYARKPVPKPDFMVILADALGCTKAERKALMDFSLARALKRQKPYYEPVTLEDLYIPPKGMTVVPVLKCAPRSNKGHENSEIEYWTALSVKIAKNRPLYIIAMNDDGLTKLNIFKDDLLLVAMNRSPRNKEPVIFGKGDDYVVRTYARKGKTVTLYPQSHDSRHKPIILKKKDANQIMGVVDSLYLKPVTYPEGT